MNKKKRFDFTVTIDQFNATLLNISINLIIIKKKFLTEVTEPKLLNCSVYRKSNRTYRIIEEHRIYLDFKNHQTSQ